MSFESLIPFIVQHNLQIIQYLTAAILFSGGFLIYRSFQHTKRSELGGDAPESGISSDSLMRLEESIKKIVEKASHVPVASSIEGVSGGEDQTHLLGEIQNLKNSLSEKQLLIEQLRTQAATNGATDGAGATAANPAAAGGAVVSEAEKNAMESQIKDLQARLSEYEIISEDIADLSKYKEENSKLQKELEAARKAGLASAAPTAQPISAALTPAQAPPPPPPAQPVASAEATGEVDDDLLKEFAAAVEQQKSKSGAAASSAPAPAPASAVEMDDLSLDMDKVAAEAIGLGGDVSGADENSDENSGKNSLDEQLNPDRLAAEADLLTKVNPEDAKLMGEFENFMKKGGT